MQTALTEGTVTRLPTRIPAKYKPAQMIAKGRTALKTFTMIDVGRNPTTGEIEPIFETVTEKTARLKALRLAAKAETPRVQEERAVVRNAYNVHEVPTVALAFGADTGVTFAQWKASQASTKRVAAVRTPVAKGPRVNAPFAPDAVVTILVAECPKRPGTKGHDRWMAGYKTGRTVAETIRHGTLMADLKWDIAHGFIKIA
jgi:hypothetical protein